MLQMLGPWTALVIVGAWIVFMVSKKTWKLTQVIGGMLLLSVLYGNFPHLPGVINSSINAIINAFSK